MDIDITHRRWDNHHTCSTLHCGAW